MIVLPELSKLPQNFGKQYQMLFAEELENVTDFHRNRAGWFCASDILPLLSKGRGSAASQALYTYIQEKAYERHIGYAQPTKGGAASGWGLHFEAIALGALGLIRNDKSFLIAEINLSATPDAMTETATVEIKCPYSFHHLTEYLSYSEPEQVKVGRFAAPSYYYQVIAQMATTKKEIGYLYFYDVRQSELQNRPIFKRINFDGNEKVIKADIDLVKTKCEEGFIILNDKIKDLWKG